MPRRAERVRRRSEVLRWGVEIASALRAAHEHGIVHRDVKPSNIRVASDGRAMLLDFGLARDASDAIQSETGSFRGSPQYASPEQIESGRRAIDARTDVYSLGATLYEVLTGVAPFRGETREQLFHNILTRDPVPPRRLEPSIPRDLETVLLAALEKDPARRPQSAAAFAADLEAVREGRPVSVRPPSAAGRAARWATRHPARAGLALALVLGIPLVAGLGGFVLASLPKLQRVDAEDHASRVEAMLVDAFLEYGEGDVDLARARFEEILRLDPRSEEALAGFALSQQDPTATLAFLDRLAPELAARAWNGRIREQALINIGKNTEAAELRAHLPPSKTSIDSFVAGEIRLMRFHGGELDAARDAFFRLREAAWSKSPASPLYHFELGHAAWHAERHDEARQIANAIESLWPESGDRLVAVGRTLTMANPQAAFDALEKAAFHPPRSLAACDLIVSRLAESARKGPTFDRALALAQETVARAPSRAQSWIALGIAHGRVPDLEAASKDFDEALRLRPDDAWAHLMRAQALQFSEAFSQSVGPASKAVRLMPKSALAWNTLGIALAEVGEDEEASRVFENALKLFPDDAEMLCNSGRLLQRTGRFEAGLSRLKRGHELGSKLASWKYRSASWVASAERKVAMERRLGEVRRGEGAHPTADELVGLAGKICGPKKRFAEATALYARAFDEEPGLKAQISASYVRDAAIAAVSAGLGKGSDPPADEAGRARLRNVARGWLEEEIKAAEEVLHQDTTRRRAVADTIKPWTTDPSFAALREADAGAAGISSEELEAWKALWRKCAALLETP